METGQESGGVAVKASLIENEEVSNAVVDGEEALVDAVDVVVDEIDGIEPGFLEKAQQELGNKAEQLKALAVDAQEKIEAALPADLEEAKQALQEKADEIAVAVKEGADKL